MSVAAPEAILLRDLLGSGTANLAADFFAGAAKIIDVPWVIAVNADLRYPQAKVAQTDEAKALNEYLRLVHRAAQVDSIIAAAIVRVINLLDRPSSCKDPR